MALAESLDDTQKTILLMNLLGGLGAGMGAAGAPSTDPRNKSFGFGLSQGLAGAMQGGNQGLNMIGQLEKIRESSEDRARQKAIDEAFKEAGKPDATGKMPSLQEFSDRVLRMSIQQGPKAFSQVAPSIASIMKTQGTQDRPYKVGQLINKTVGGKEFQGTVMGYGDNGLPIISDLQPKPEKDTYESRVDYMANKPLGKDAVQYVHPETLRHPTPKMSIADAEKEGYVVATPKQYDELYQMENTRSIIKTLDSASKKIITADTPVKAMAQAITLKAGAATKANETAAYYQDAQKQFIGVISRNLGGERGVLTDQDIERVSNGLPKFSDTKAIRDTKMELINKLYEIATEAKKRNIFGKGLDTESYRTSIDEILNRLDSSNVQKSQPAGGQGFTILKVTPTR